MKMKRTSFLTLFFIGLFLSFCGITAKASETETEKNGLIRPSVTYVSESEASDLFAGKQSKTYNSDWDKYATYYYYNQLSPNEQALYDSLNAMCLSYLEGTETISNNTTSYVSYTGLSPNTAYYTAFIFYYSNPQYYYLYPYVNVSYSGTSGRVAFQIYSDFANGTTRQTKTAAFKTKLDSYVSQVNAQSTDLAKEKKAHDLIASITTYNLSASYNQSAYSVFCNGESVCAGYAFALSMLCNAAGIDTAVVTSYDHAWNYIRLNDSWYYIDSTWDDYDGYTINGTSYEIIYTYFNRNTTKLLANDQANSHVTESLWDDYLPSCTLDSGATTTSTGSIKTPSKTTAKPTIKVSNTTSTEKTIKLTCSTSGALIYYTTDGSTPSAASSKSYLYTGSFTTSLNSTIKAIAVTNTYYDSAVGPVAATPSISTQPVSKSYTYGSTATALTVKASTSDSGKLTYQWYKNSKNSTSGGTLIKNATKATYTPSVTSLGTTYYYCVIKNTNSSATSKTATKTSSTAKIKVSAKSISKCTISSMATKTYTGSALKQSITIKNGSSKLTVNKDYTVTYKNNKAIGKATVTIKGKGNYTGSASYTFKIIPKKVTLKSLTAKTKKIKVTWKKDSTVKGYQIQYSTSKSFSSKKTVTIKKASTTSYTISSLKAKKTYYIRVRSYKVVNGTTYYGSWSTIKKAKTK